MLMHCVSTVRRYNTFSKSTSDLEKAFACYQVFVILSSLRKYVFK